MSFKYLIIALLVCVSCGKKALESDHSNDRNLTYSEAEVNFYISRDIKRCVQNNDYQQLRKIIEENKHLKLDELNHDGETLLTKAVSLGHIAVARILIEAGAGINVTNINNETPLIVAVNKKLKNVVSELLTLGAELNKKDIFGDTALMVAIKSQQEELAIELIENGSDILMTDRYNRTAYTLAQLYELAELTERIKLILEEKFGEPSLEEFRNQILQGELAQISRTLSRFSHLAQQYEDINPLSLLSYRESEGDIIEAAKLFLKTGVKIDGPDKAKATPPLIEAMINLKFSYVDFLIKNNADVNKLSSDNFPPLYYAIELNEPELVSTLYYKGAKKRLNNFDACSLVKSIGEEFSSSAEKKKNKQIKKILSCSFFIRT